MPRWIPIAFALLLTVPAGLAPFAGAGTNDFTIGHHANFAGDTYVFKLNPPK